MPSRALRATALAISFLVPAGAAAAERVRPTAIDPGFPVKQAVGTADGTLWLLEGELSPYRRRDDAPNAGPVRILAWDLGQSRAIGEVKGLPPGVEHMAAVGGDLLVACGANGIAVVDPKARSVTRRIATEGLTPRFIVGDWPAGRVGAVCGTGDTYDQALVEVDLETDEVKALLGSSRGGHIAASRDLVVVQGPFSNSPAGTPDFHRLGEVRGGSGGRQGARMWPRPNARNDQGSRGWHQDWGPFRTLQGGAFFTVSEEETDSILGLPADCDRVVWTAKGELWAVHPAKPLLVARVRDKDSGRWGRTKSWRIAGLHGANGRELFQLEVDLGRETDLGGRGDPVRTAQTLVPAGDGDRLVYATRERDGRSDVVRWWAVSLPRTALESVPILEGVPAAAVRLTQSFAFAPKVVGAKSGVRFSLAQAPAGMTIDPESARIAWTPQGSVVGSHMVEVSAAVGREVVPVFAFSLRVTPADEFPAEAIDFGDLSVAQVVAGSDGALFLLEARPQDQGAALPSSRVLVWDLERGALAETIDVPKTPESMTRLGEWLVVSCPESEVVSVIDTKRRRVVRSIPLEVDRKPLVPVRVFLDAPEGRAIVACRGGERSGGAGGVVEVDLERGSVEPLYFPFGRVGYASFGKDRAVWSDGGPGGVSRISELRRRPTGRGERVRAPSEGLPYTANGARAVNGGTAFLARDGRGEKTALISDDWERVLWTAEGGLLAVHPTKTVALLRPFDAMRSIDASDTWTVHGVNTQSGRRLWQVVVRMPGPQRIDPWAFAADGALAIRASGAGDELIFCPSRDPFGRERATWYRVPLPASEGSAVAETITGAEPPSEVRVGETLEWSPKLDRVKAARFDLVHAPSGMRVDERTGTLTWTPTEAAIGKHDVKLVARVGKDEIPFVFELRVRPR